MKKTRLRTGVYIRVSTEEQKLKKNSVIAQQEIAEEFIKNNPEHMLVDIYVDEAISGRKFVRTDLQRLLKDVEDDKLDVIIFTKLDRWFRDIGLYYKTQEVLDRHNTSWRAILEDYNTLTADGRLKVNIMLSVAQNEAERTSERIKVVQEYKVRHGHAISGSHSYGFKLERHENYSLIVKDEEHEAFVYEFLDHFEATQSLAGSVKYMNNKYDINMSSIAYRNMITDTMMYGSYRGNDEFCPAYITKERYDRLNGILANNIKCNTKKGRVYIFSGLIRCPICGTKMAGHTTFVDKPSGKRFTYKNYVCAKYKSRKTCDYKSAKSENVAERLLLKELRPQFENMMIESEIQKAKPQPKIDKKAIQQEIDRLNKMYQKGRIDDDTYDEQYDELSARLDAIIEVPERDHSKIKEILDSDFESLYKTFTDAEKQIFFRSIIESITVDGDKISINFL